MTTNNSSNQQFSNNADGLTLKGGTTPRAITVTGGDVTIAGSGSNTYTFPSITSVLACLGLAQVWSAVQTFTSLVLTGKITTYNNIATAGNGVMAIVASGRTVGTSAAVASVTAYTVGASDSSFDIAANVNITAATTASFTVTCTYTDESNTSRTVTFSFVQNGVAVPIQTITNVTGVGAYCAMVMRIRCKSGTTITIASTGTFTSVTYSIEGSVVQVA